MFVYKERSGDMIFVIISPNSTEISIPVHFRRFEYHAKARAADTESIRL